MNNCYEIVLASDSTEHVLTYQLAAHRPAQIWSELVKKYDVTHIRQSLNPWRGMYADSTARVSALNALISEMNLWLTSKIVGVWNDADPLDSLNRLHVHFPEHKKIEKDPVRKQQLTQYNDLIHELQFLFNISQTKREYPYLLVVPDTEVDVWGDLIDNDYALFDSNFNFGDLTLHYPHVGRNPLELCISNDTNCPADQIIPQYKIGPHHALRFFNVSISQERFTNFYKNSKLEWPLAADNKKLAVGYIKLGKLQFLDGKICTSQQVLAAIKSCNRIVNWKIF